MGEGSPAREDQSGTCLSYVPFEQSSIHNSNLLGAALLARVATYTSDPEAMELAREAVRYTCSRQNPDGSWFYGEHFKYHWVDNFHTGYNLDSLNRYIKSSGDREFETNLKVGLQYLTSHCFEEGAPEVLPRQNLPHGYSMRCQIDRHAYLFWGTRPRSPRIGPESGQVDGSEYAAPDGHFYYRDLGWKTVRTQMLHWWQASMFKALAHS